MTLIPVPILLKYYYLVLSSLLAQFKDLSVPRVSGCYLVQYHWLGLPLLGLELAFYIVVLGEWPKLLFVLTVELSSTKNNM